MLSEPEITRGLVLHLDPDTLEREGGVYTCSADARVQSGHFFLCLSVGDAGGRWLPLYTNPGVGRRRLSPLGRSGHPKWTNAVCSYHVGQVWTAPHSAVMKAADAGRDMSRAGSRNTVANRYIPTL